MAFFRRTPALGKREAQRIATSAAVLEFQADMPGEQVTFTTVAADEPERFVIGVSYLGTAVGEQVGAQRCRYYAVLKGSFEVAALDADEGYPPR